MKYRIVILLVCLMPVAWGCAGKTETEKKQPPPPDATETIITESKTLEQVHAKSQSKLERIAPQPEIKLEPVIPEYNPLENHQVSFSLMDEDLKMALYAIAASTGMSLIIDPEINPEDHRVTINFENVSAHVVLTEILSAHDLTYSINQNIIRVHMFEEQLFQVSFMDTVVETSFDIGGDVLGSDGGSGSDSASGLSGNFRLTGKSNKIANPYDIMEQMVKTLISPKGKYTINRMAGTLYIKDRPSVLKSVARVIAEFKEMQSQQILIEARIIEVILGDNFEYGIDWNVVKDHALNAEERYETAWNLANGLVFQHQNKDLNIQKIAIEALSTFGDSKVISNPRLRTKHGKPAIMSVGTSYTYKKSVEKTETSSSNQDKTETEVQVSTVFDGLILGVVPFIEPSGQITLLINPIKSDVDQDSLQLEAVGEDDSQSIALPRVNIKEISTTIGVNSGDVVVLGGLIDKETIKLNKEVPLLGKIPGLGWLFKSDYETDQHRELVIILSVTKV